MKKIISLLIILFSSNLSAQVYKFSINSKGVKLETTKDSLKSSSKVLYTSKSDVVEIYKNSSKVFLGKETLDNLNSETINKYKDMDGVDGLVDYSLRYSVDGDCVDFYYYKVYATCTSCLSMSELTIDKEDWSIDIKRENKVITYKISNLEFK
jgi:hypothetical protein